MALVALNLIFPGAALFWYRQSLQAIAYLLAFGILNVFRHDIGAMWAVFVWCVAQIYFFKLRKAGSEQGFRSAGKVIIWLLTGAVVVLYSLMYGPSWTHAGQIRYPLLLYLLVMASLIVPAALLALSLPRRLVQGASSPGDASA